MRPHHRPHHAVAGDLVIIAHGHGAFLPHEPAPATDQVRRRPVPTSNDNDASEGVSADVLQGHYEEVASRFEADGWIDGRKTMAEMAKSGPS